MRRVARTVKKIRQWCSLRRRGHHRRLSHIVVRTVVRDVKAVRGEFEFYWRRAFRCLQCQKSWLVD